MKLLNVQYPDVVDPVPTEDTIREGLIKNKDTISDEYALVDCNWAKCINHAGIPQAQQVLAQISHATNNNHIAEKLIFVCQHIHAEKLQWPSELVFCPHATKGNKFIPIPHAAVNYSTEKNSGELLASFMGSFETHWTRKELSRYASDQIIIKDSGKWYYENPDSSRKDEYIRLLSSSKFSICPRGTGPSTIRIWEAMASGSIPVIISDPLLMPDIGRPWTDIAIFIPEWMICFISDILGGYSNKQISAMSDGCQEVYHDQCDTGTIWECVKRKLV